WRAAAAVFPQLAGLLASPNISVGPPKLSAAAVTQAQAVDGHGLMPPPPGLPQSQTLQSVGALPDPCTLAPAVVPGVRRRRARDKSMFASALLVGLVVVLLVVLFFVLRRQYAIEEGQPVDSRPSTAAESS